MRANEKLGVFFSVCYMLIDNCCDSVFLRAKLMLPGSRENQYFILMRAMCNEKYPGLIYR